MNKFKLIAKKIFLSFVLGFNYEKKIENAYNYLKKNNQLKIIEKIKIEIEKKEITNKIKFSNSFKNNPDLSNNLIKTLNQILNLNFIFFSNFSSQLAICLHKNKVFYFPLPREWLNIVNKNGIKTNFALSKFLFSLSSILYLAKDIIKIINLSISKNINLNRNNSTIVYLPDIPNISFQDNYLNPKYNFLFWLKDFLNIKNKVIFLHDNKKISDKNFKDIEIKYVKFFLLSNLNLYERIFFIFYVFQVIFYNLCHIFKGNFYFFYSLKDFYFAHCVKKFFSKTPNFTIFNSGNCLIRPWWTFLIENKNYKKVYTAFYSSNHFPHYSYEKYYSGVRLMTWNNYIFWTEEQKLWLDKINNNYKEYSIVGYFPFFGKNVDLEKNKKIASIFPITPYEIKYLYREMYQYHYYSTENSIKFLKDIMFIFKDLDLEIYIKLKRNNPEADKRYVDFIKRLGNEKNITIISSDVAPISLIDKSDIIIAPPFSSPCLIAEYFNKSAIYYDPTNKLPLVEPTIKKVKLIKDFDELKYFIKKILI